VPDGGVVPQVGPADLDLQFGLALPQSLEIQVDLGFVEAAVGAGEPVGEVAHR
jgi:hypothetical protein